MSYSSGTTGMFTLMQEEDLLIICGMTPVMKLSSISYRSIYLPPCCHMAFRLSLVLISRLES